ncbi:AraC family transcriptional regulator [Paenibacillus sp. FSL H7-0326]|uniref:AraC family transcriptional regulator n=1 Tax=Paenibacillus sp. FSL H7-0326 TaxID=1921144 RepID=UPI00096C268C|nr:AraC family transcriptional regulator [Paenibacillus sp. FSL H7-0326]OMC69189.1 AraC family transcriptional regulator [Paenibacillus sp. FSL H7-0326]
MQDSYSVASNPVDYEKSPLHVLFVGESQTKPGHALGPKIYDYYLLHYVESGKGVFRTESRTYHLSAGHIFLIHPSELVSYVSDEEEPWRYRWMAFTGKEADKQVKDAGFSLDQPVITTMQDSKMSTLLSTMQNAFFEKKESAHLTSIGCLYLIFAEAKERLVLESAVAMTDSQVGRTVKQMIQYMSTQYAHPISIEQMSASLGYNRAYLSRIFKKEIGLSPVTYLLKLRIDKSRQLLRERPELSIEQISASVGLPDALYFSRQFKRFYRHSPSAYRKQMQERSNGTSPD